MIESDPIAMPIGAVSKLTGISGHTLRKWESRYEAVEPLRTDTGRRLYTQEQVQRLILLRDLIGQGHQISQLSGMEDAELEALAEEQPAPAREVRFDRAIVVGQVLSAVLKRELAGRAVTMVADSADRWLAAPVLPSELESCALVVELPTLRELSIDSLLRLRRDSFARVIVVFGFASQKSIRRLLDGGILCLKAPVNTGELLRNLQLPDERASVLEVLEDKAIPAYRFSSEAIARLAALSPKLQCECPNHIAQLLLDISAFERYSMECEDSDPAERALHARLRLISANARALFEEAMADVAENENLELDEL